MAPNDLSPLWFINELPDFEREQWTMFAYLRDAKKDLQENKIDPFLCDIKHRLQDIECFLTTRTLISKLNSTDSDKLAAFNARIDGDHCNQEVFKIVRWALPILQDLRKEFNNLWRLVESSFNIFYINDKPNDKVNRGILMVRYGGSPVTEVYKFDNCTGFAQISHVEYTQDNYLEIKEKLGAVDTDVFIIAESNIAFDTQRTAMPFLRETLIGKVLA